MDQGQIPGASAHAVYPVPAHSSELQIPLEVLSLIPDFDGDTRMLNFFLKKCDYVIERYQGDVERTEFLMQCITSKLKGKAAALISNLDVSDTYADFKSLMIHHFGDHRSEECVAIELETLKIRPYESYIEFCSRIEYVLTVLLSKINSNSPATLKEAKRVIYTDTSLNTFLYNLPEDMVQFVRLKKPATLKEALKYVIEEVNFQEEYNARKRMLQDHPQQGYVFDSSNPKPYFIPNQTSFPNKHFAPNRLMSINPHIEFKPQPGSSSLIFGSKPSGFGSSAPKFGSEPKTSQAQLLSSNQQVNQFGFKTQPQGFGGPKAFSFDMTALQGKNNQSFQVKELSNNTKDDPVKENSDVKGDSLHATDNNKEKKDLHNK